MPLTEATLDMPKFLGKNFTYPAYSPIKEITADFCIGWKAPPCHDDQEATHLTSEAWTYTTAGEVWGMPQWLLIHVYGGGGYIAELDVNKDVSKLIMQELWDNMWIDHQTRVVLLEFTVYNAQVNLFTTVMVGFEFLESGGVIAYPRIYPLGVYSQGANEIFTLIMAVAFIIFIIYYTIRMLIGVCRTGRKYFTHVWHVIDLFTFIASYMIIGMYAMRAVFTSATINKMHETKGKKFVNFQHVAVWDEMYITLLGLIAFVIIIRLLRMLRFNRDVGSFVTTLRLAKKQLGGFFLIFFCYFFAFASSGYLFFGRYIADFSSVLRSMSALFLTLLGKSYFYDMVQVDSLFGKLYFMAFVIIAVFLLTNFMLAIICESIDNARGMDEKSEEYKVISLLMKKIKKAYQRVILSGSPV